MVLSKGYEIIFSHVLENLINGNWQEERIHFSRNQSWIRVQNSDQISLWRRGFSEYFRLFMLNMRWKISLPQSHYFEFEIYLEKHSNWMWLEYFIDSSNLVPRASISFFITDIRYKKGYKKAPGSRLWLSQRNTFPVLGYFSDFRGEFYWLVFQNILLQKPLKYWNTCPIHCPAGTGGITDFLKPS